MRKIDADLIIIGGGASGIMAAITAAEQGIRVLLLEQQEKIGRKLSATGNGRCNFTNSDMKPEYYFQGEENQEEFVTYALETFPPERIIKFFQESGIMITEKNGYWYPLAGQAELVKETLLFRFLYEKKTSVKQIKNRKCKCSCQVKHIYKQDQTFYVTLQDGYVYTASTVLLACGSPAAPQLGGSDAGFYLAKAFGHTIIPAYPALCGLKTSHAGWEKAAGVRINVNLSVYQQDGSKRQWIGQQQGELQITSYGISGIPVFQLSGRCIRYIEQKRTVKAVINFVPTVTLLYEFFQTQQEQYPDKPINLMLSGILPEKLADMIFFSIFGKQSKHKAPISSFSDKQLKNLAKTIQTFEIPLIGYKGFEHAQASTGGISVSEICDKTMESKLVAGLYFSGEIMDIDGICGGYNLHWAWASGYLAGKAAASYNLFKKR